MYALPPGKTLQVGSDTACAIHVEGLGIQPEMCSLVSQDELTVELRGFSAQEEPTLKAQDAGMGRRASLFKGGVAQVFINNQLVTEDRQLQNKDKLRIGLTHLFQLFIPQEREQRSRS